MSEESTTSDLVQLARRRVDAVDRGDIEAMASFLAPDAIWDSTPMGLEVYEGRAAIGRFLTNWWAAYDAYAAEAEEIVEFANGVTLAVILFAGRPVGSSGTSDGDMQRSACGWITRSRAIRTTLTSTRPALPPDASPRSGGRRCRRRTSRSSVE
jgi:hypothetical protein